MQAKGRRVVASVALYGLLLAGGTFALQWLDYQRIARSHTSELYLFLIAAGFLLLGIYLGARIIARPHATSFDGNPAAVASLGISERELAVLHELAEGRSNKEISARLNISPNTVKTHVARLFEKLGARRRTEAIRKARELQIVR